jgi:hypothetical protein
MAMTFNQDGASTTRPPPPPPATRPPPPPIVHANDACISARSCEELQSMFVDAFPFKRAPICAESDAGLGPGGTILCTSDGFEQSRAVCFEAGARLCTISEIMGGATGNTGCGFNDDLIWSSSVCSSGENGIACTNGNPRTLAGHVDGVPDDETCITDLTSQLGIRWCGFSHLSHFILMMSRP